MCTLLFLASKCGFWDQTQVPTLVWWALYQRSHLPGLISVDYFNEMHSLDNSLWIPASLGNWLAMYSLLASSSPLHIKPLRWEAQTIKPSSHFLKCCTLSSNTCSSFILEAHLGSVSPVPFMLKQSWISQNSQSKQGVFMLLAFSVCLILGELA